MKRTASLQTQKHSKSILLSNFCVIAGITFTFIWY